MPLYKPSTCELGNIVLSAYSTLNPQSAEDRQVNASLVAHVDQWFKSSDRQVSNPAAESVNQFIAAELDFVTTGNRGMGRLNDDWPRLGGKYRSILKTMSDENIKELHQVLGDQVACGYLFCEYLVQCVTGSNVPRIDYSNASAELLESWVPTIYSQFGPRAFDARMERENPNGYYDVKGLWGHATGDLVDGVFRKNRIPIDEFFQLLLRQYFDAGMMLRLAETERSTKVNRTEPVLTEGKYSHAPSKNRGCLTCLLAFVVGVASMYWSL